MPEVVPAELRAFVLRYIDSVGALEAVLIMRGAPTIGWTPDTLAPRLYTTPAEASSLLARLAEDGFLVEDRGGYWFRCATPEMERSLDALAAFYPKHLIAVTNLIHSKPRRIREFADAFKLKKER